MMPIDWLQKLHYYLHTLAFCLAISAIQYAFRPDRPYELPLVYSLCIGSSTWAGIDFGRHLFRSAVETGWPRGAQGLWLALAGIVGGYLIGTLAGDWWFGWSSWGAAGRAQLPVSILVTALAGITGTYYFYTRNRHHYLETKMSEAKRHASEAKLKLLETQLEPHMLFNTLANLRVLVASDTTRAQTMLDHLIAYLRATLSASRASSHPLQDEFERLRDYLELMAVRMGSRLSYTLELPSGLAALPIPAMLLQPIVENAIKHGLEPKVEGGQIRVRASQFDDTLVLEVVDTGVGMVDATRNSAGFGLDQVRQRLASAYDRRATLRCAAGNEPGTTVTISLPLPA